MLMIRFQRIGRTNDPAFRIAVLEKERAAQAGNIVEQLGTYNPRSKALTLNEERVKHWIAMGAQPTDSIKNLLITKKVIEGKKVNALPKKTVQVDEEAVKAAAEAEKKAKDEAAAAKAAEEAAAAAPVEEAPAVEEAAPEAAPIAEEVAMPTEAEVVAEAEPAPPEEVAVEAAPEVVEAPTEDLSSVASAEEETPAA
jgi:small subunit ribosomal protein S16